MDFLLSLSTDDIILGIVGVIGIVCFTASLRAMRKERLDYDSRHKVMEDRIKQTAHDIRDYNNNLRGNEQLHMLAASLSDALELKGHDAKNIISEKQDHITLNLPHEILNIHYLWGQRAQMGRTRNSRTLWEVKKDGNTLQSYQNIRELEAYILDKLNKNFFKQVN